MPFRLALPLLLLLLGAYGAFAAETVVVSRQAALAGFAVDGVVEARAQASVAAQNSGRIVSVHVEAGDKVEKGQLLARIDAREAAETVAAARARLAQASAAYARSQQLLEKKFISPAALDQARAERDAARAHLRSAEAGESHARIVSPLSGVVARRLAEAGDLAMPGRALFQIMVPGALRVTAQVPQHRLAELRAAREAKIEPGGAVSTSAPTFASMAVVHSRAITILPTLDAATHSVETRVDLPAGAVLPPGLAVRVHFLVGEARRLAVPESALIRRSGLALVQVQAADGSWRLRQLRLGVPLPDGQREILAGLVEGERIRQQAAP